MSPQLRIEFEKGIFHVTARGWEWSPTCWNELLATSSTEQPGTIADCAVFRL